MLSPLVQWIENGIPPGPVVASGINFTSAPTTRSRPLCPYPQQARFIGGPEVTLASQLTTRVSCRQANKVNVMAREP
jgi:Tannase and feruloyl esterase